MAETKKTPVSGSNNTPGTVIKPQTASPQAAQPVQPPAAPAAPAAPVQPAPAPAPPPQAPPQPAPEPPVAQTLPTVNTALPPEQPQDSAPDPSTEVPDSAVDDSQSITWTASEFVAHQKTASWYLILIISAIAITILVFLITKDKISATVVIVAAILMGVYGSHQPRQLEYKISPRGLSIGGKYHTYEEFRSFSVLQEGAFSSINFMPLKRFAIPLTIYYAPEQEEEIISLLSGSLPFEEHRSDAVDTLMRRIRF
jgi:hypothetical protein